MSSHYATYNDIDVNGNVIQVCDHYSPDHRWAVMRGRVLICTTKTRGEARRVSSHQGGQPRCHVTDRWA